MLWTSIKRVFRSGFFNFWRNGFVSLSSVLVMVVTLFAIGYVIFMSAILTTSLSEIKNKVDINVYFVTTASADDIISLQKTVEGLPEVLSVVYTSREDALTAFKDRHQNDDGALTALDELADNPLGASLNIKAKDSTQYESISNFLQGKNIISADGSTIVDKVTYAQHKVAIDKLNKIIDAVHRLGFIISLVLVLVSVLITFNTIRLAIYLSKEEISVMRLVGASQSYIRGPFIIGGIMYGLVSALITLIIFYPITLWLGKATSNFFIGLNIFHYYVSNLGVIALIIIGSGILIGAVSSFFAVRKYLKV